MGIIAVSAGAKNWPTVENRKLITNSKLSGRPCGRPNSPYENAIVPRIRLVPISTMRLSQRSTYTPARTPKITDGMISVSTATLSSVLEWPWRWTSTTMPYQIAFCAV